MNESKSNLNDYVIVVMLEPQPVGYRFSSWPLHMTVLPWFSASEYQQVETVCKQAVEDMTPFTVKVMSREYFGQRRLPVMLVERSPDLVNLHMQLLRAVEVEQWDMPGRYVGELFKPHITQKKGKDAEAEVLVDSLYIAEKLGQGYRQIVGKVDL